MEEDKQAFDYEEVDMHSRNVTDISPILKVVSSNRAVKRVNLSDNYITELPPDLSMLEEVYEFNLIDNELNPFDQAVQALSTMPKLKSLHLNLHEESQVDFVIRTLPNLEFLNGETIDREELHNESSKDDQPTDYSKDHQSIKQIKEVDEEDYQSDHPSIKEDKKVQNEKDKNSNSSYEEAWNEILNHSDSEEITLKPHDLEAVALIFDKVRNLHRKNKLSNDKEMANEFDKHLKTWMQKLSDIVTSKNNNTNIKNSAILKTKFDLGEIWHQKALKYLERKEKGIGKIYSKTYQIHSEVISEFEKLYTSLALKYDKKKNENQSLQKQVEEFKEKLQKANVEKAAVLDIGENIEKQMQAKLAENNKLHSEYKQRIDELNAKVKEMEQENSTLFEKLIKHAKDRTDKVLSSSPYKIDSTPKLEYDSKSEMRSEFKSDMKSEFKSEMRLDAMQERVDQNTKPDTMKLFSMNAVKKNEAVGVTNVRIVTLKQLKDIINEIYENKEKHDEKWRRTKLPLETMEQFMFTFLNQKYGLKNLVIEWAASIVNGVKWYMKEDSDVSLFAKLLKNEIEEDFRYIQDRIKTTVSKVLRKHLREKHKLKSELEINNIQENLEQGFVSNSTWNYILDYIYEEADKEKILTMLQEKKKIGLNSENLYSNRGRNVTPPKYTNAKTNYTASPISYRTKDLTPTNKSKPKGRMHLGEDASSNERQEEYLNKVMQEKDNTKICIQDLIFWICTFQMMQHEKSLYRFVTLFKSVDTDKDGIINEQQFKFLIKQMKIIPASVNSEDALEEEIEKLLMLIDPHKTQQITFSELVTFLTLTESNVVEPNKDLNLSHGQDAEGNMGDEERREEDEEQRSGNGSLTLLDKINEADALS